jgi:protease IV
MEDNVTPPLDATQPPVTPPPPAPPPPVIVPPPASAPTRQGRGWMFLALVLFLFLAFSMLLNLGAFTSSFLRGASSAHHRAGVAGPRLDEVLLEDHDASDKIAVIRVDGIITSQIVDQGGNSLVEVIRAQLRAAEDDSRVKAVILRVDSPGGEVLASDEIARSISAFQDKTRKPVIAAMDGVAASGGYYISAPCRWIVANELTITGSIGVIMSSWNYRGLMDKVGVLPKTYKSGRFSRRRSPSSSPWSRKVVRRPLNGTRAGATKAAT